MKLKCCELREQITKKQLLYRKYFEPSNDGSYDSYHSATSNYEPGQVKSGFSDIRNNVPGEPGVSYPTHTKVPRTSFSCADRKPGNDI